MAAQIQHHHLIERWGKVIYGKSKIDAIHVLQDKAHLSVENTCYACNGKI